MPAHKGVGTKERNGVFALSVGTGAMDWSYVGGTDPYGIAATGGKVYIGGSPAALGQGTGRPPVDAPGVCAGQRRQRRLGPASSSTPGRPRPGPTPQSPDGSVIAMDAPTGNVLWQYRIGSEGMGNVTVGNGFILVTDTLDYGGTLMLDSASGTPLGELTHFGAFYIEQPVMVDGAVYLLGNDADSWFIDRWALPGH